MHPGMTRVPDSSGSALPSHSSSPTDTGLCSRLHVLSVIGAWSLASGHGGVHSPACWNLWKGPPGLRPLLPEEEQESGFTFVFSILGVPFGGQVGREGEGSGWCYDVALDIE